MTEKLLKEFSHQIGGARLVPGSKGAFEVSINGKKVHSKLETGRFPTAKELREHVKAAVQG